ncbi:DUF6179 domain-containing protein [Coprobacillus cateniformis]|uniref:DUF6179 domain-containing protein n=1 Tax=Coprobacillus cateniformis TaxID=100884 RepID=UPI0034A2902C
MEISKVQLSFEELLDSKYLAIEIKDKITQGMINILMEKMRRYTGGDSSLSKEKTQSLMDSILYTLSFYMRDIDMQNMIEILKTQDVVEVYKQSQYHLLQQLHHLYLRVQELQSHKLNISLDVYQETITKGLTAFFDVYNFDYCSQDIVLTLDYPTCYPLKQVGLEQIIEYVHYLEIEHDFLNCFQESDIEKVLKGYCFYEHGIIDNISLLFINQLLIKSLIGYNQDFLFQNQEEINQLYQVLSSYSSKELYDVLYRQLQILIMSLESPYQQEILIYFTYILNDLVSYLHQHNQFHTLKNAVACAF